MPTDGVEVNVAGDLTDDRGEGPADIEQEINPNGSFLIGPTGFNQTVAIPFYGIPYDTRFLTHNPYQTYANYYDPVNGQRIPSDQHALFLRLYRNDRLGHAMGLPCEIDQRAPTRIR